MHQFKTVFTLVYFIYENENRLLPMLSFWGYFKALDFVSALGSVVSLRDSVVGSRWWFCFYDCFIVHICFFLSFCGQATLILTWPHPRLCHHSERNNFLQISYCGLFGLPLGIERLSWGAGALATCHRALRSDTRRRGHSRESRRSVSLLRRRFRSAPRPGPGEERTSWETVGGMAERYCGSGCISENLPWQVSGGKQR